MNLRAWIRRNPIPTMLAVTSDRGREMVAVKKSADGTYDWKGLLTTIGAYNPSRIEALDDHGLVLRAHDLEREGEEPAGEVAPVAEARIEATRDESLMNIVLNASDRGAQRHAEAFAASNAHVIALSQMCVDLAMQANNRAQAAETAYLTAVQAISELTQAAAQPDAPAPGLADSPMIQQLLGLALAKGLGPAAAHVTTTAPPPAKAAPPVAPKPPTTNGATNGAAHIQGK